MHTGERLDSAARDERQEGIEGLAWLTDREVTQVGALVGLLGIFYDAALAHGLFWENDPYWTYWITKTFLIASVVSLMTAFFGLGLAQGAVATAVHAHRMRTGEQEAPAPLGVDPEPVTW